MNRLFYNKGTFDEDIGGWDTSKCTNMFYMFHSASAFDQDISGWDTSQCTSMYGMFRYAAAFDQDISGWDTSKCTSMGEMFNGAAAFSQDISPWCVQLISSEPGQFGNSGTDPTWGSCPCRTRAAGNVNCEVLADFNLGAARDLWFSNQAACVLQYGHVRDW
jgi:surface protein